MPPTILNRLHAGLMVFVATGAWIGCFVDIGQATIASALVLFTIPWFASVDLTAQIIFTIAVTLVGIYSSSVTEKEFATKDDHRIVIDEIAAMFVTFLGLPLLSLPWMLVGLGLNRAFDITKPFGIRRLQNIKGGLGIVLDDIAAGICANIILRILLAIF